MSLKHIVVLEGHTEKELLIATQELRQRAKRDGIRASISAARLAALMEKTGANEALLRQRLRDLEGKKVLAIIAGQSGHPQTLGGNGQISRRCLPVHFPRYQLQREEDCIEFQAVRLALLQKVPLNCDAETFVRSYWLYFYECGIGCIGVLKDWLLRAVSTALDEGRDTLTLDWIQDHAPLVDICRQMALDATEGEQKLNHTESNREHLWRLLQGGEVIAPVPPLPPRETLPAEPAPVADTRNPPLPLKQAPLPAASPGKEAPAVPVKKTRTRKKPKENPPTATEQGSLIQAEPGEALAPDPPKRRRRKTPETVVENAELRVKAQSSMNGDVSSEPINTGDAILPTKPKRTRRVGEPKPQRYPVGEREAERGT